MNHRTDWDIIGVFHKPFVVIVSPYWKKFQSLVTFLGAKVNMIYARQQAGDTFVSSSMRDSVIHAIQQHFLQTASHPIPLVIFPEGGTTNGRGILQFNKTILGIAPEVLPLAIDIRFPFPLPIHVDYLFDSWITNVWWSFFFPLIVYEFTFLPRQVNNKKRKKICNENHDLF